MDTPNACLPCGHVFCAECLLATLRETKKCPTCMTPFKKRTKVFLQYDAATCAPPVHSEAYDIAGAWRQGAQRLSTTTWWILSHTAPQPVVEPVLVIVLNANGQQLVRKELVRGIRLLAETIDVFKKIIDCAATTNNTDILTAAGFYAHTLDEVMRGAFTTRPRTILTLVDLTPSRLAAVLARCTPTVIRSLSFTQQTCFK